MPKFLIKIMYRIKLLFTPKLILPSATVKAIEDVIKPMCYKLRIFSKKRDLLAFFILDKELCSTATCIEDGKAAIAEVLDKEDNLVISNIKMKKELILEGGYNLKAGDEIQLTFNIMVPNVL